MRENEMGYIPESVRRERELEEKLEEKIRQAGPDVLSDEALQDLYDHLDLLNFWGLLLYDGIKDPEGHLRREGIIEQSLKKSL